MARTLLGVEEQVGSNAAITAALSAIEKDRAAIEQLKNGADPDGVSPDSTWMEGFQALRDAVIKGHVESIKSQMSKDVATDPKLGTLLRGNEEKTKPAWEFARSLLASQAAQASSIEVAFASTHTNKLKVEFPGFSGHPDLPTPPAFHSMVRQVLGDLSRVFLPPGAGYVQGDLMKMLVPLYTHLQESAPDADINRPMSLVVANTLFLRGLTSSMTLPLSNFPADQTGRQAVMKAIQILTSAINRTGDYKSKLSPDFFPDVEETGNLAEAFLQEVVNRLGVEAAQQKTLRAYTEIGTGD